MAPKSILWSRNESKMEANFSAIGNKVDEIIIYK